MQTDRPNPRGACVAQTTRDRRTAGKGKAHRRLPRSRPRQGPRELGPVRDLPSSAKEVPKNVTDPQVRRLGIDVNDHFEPIYVVPDNKKDRVRDLRAALKDASEVYLATDEDREGEAISWHVLELLKPTVPVKRMVFHEITPQAIEAAIDNSRQLDMKLVEAQEGRRILDRLFGYEMSVVTRRRAGGATSAGGGPGAPPPPPGGRGGAPPELPRPALLGGGRRGAGRTAAPPPARGGRRPSSPGHPAPPP